MSRNSEDQFNAPSSEKEIVEHLRSESKVIDIESEPTRRGTKKSRDEYLERVQKRVRTEYLMEGLRRFNNLPLEEISQKCMAADDMADLSDAELDNDQLARRYWKYAMRVANRSRAEMGREYRSAEHEEIEGDALLGLAMGINKYREAGRDSTKIIRRWIKIGIDRGIQNRDPYKRHQRAKIKDGLQDEKNAEPLEHEPYQERDTAQKKSNENLEAFFQMLSKDEVEVARLMAQGLRYSAIAEKLDVSERTVERRVRQMRDHLTADKHTEWMAKNCLSQYSDKKMAV